MNHFGSTAADESALTAYRREHVGFVFQFYNLIPSLTARENVALVTEIAEAEGPVAALFEAMTRATGVPMQLESYQVHSIGIGADARGEANLSVRCDGVEHAGLGTSRDIIEASALAWLDVANRVLRQREAQSSTLAATA